MGSVQNGVDIPWQSFELGLAKYIKIKGSVLLPDPIHVICFYLSTLHIPASIVLPRNYCQFNSLFLCFSLLPQAGQPLLRAQPILHAQQMPYHNLLSRGSKVLATSSLH